MSSLNSSDYERVCLHFEKSANCIFKNTQYDGLLFYSILNPITSLVLPENFLFSLIRGRTGISVLPRENRKFCSPSGGKVNPLIFELDSKWNKITYLLFIVKSKQNRKFSGNFSYLDLSRLF